MNSTEKRKSRRRSQESGLVLIDVLFAVTVLMVSALYLVEARGNSITRAVNTARLRIARMLASQKMEEVLVNEISKEPADDFFMAGTFEEEGYDAYSFSIEEELFSISSDEDLEDSENREWFIRRITVTVTYSGEGGKEESFSVATILPDVEEEEEGGG